MKFLGIRDVSANETGIHYRKEYNASAVFETLTDSTRLSPVRFVVEHSPVGGFSVEVEFLESIDYPIVTAKRKIRECVVQMDQTNQLP